MFDLYGNAANACPWLIYLQDVPGVRSATTFPSHETERKLQMIDSECDGDMVQTRGAIYITH